ncbi:fibronectin type III domain-containing protein [Labilibaculum sp.]|uniref:fibronectin type III domain-containing protein n=1 Tax=Labilibaculum sp. TaxID=2060723 RepID=UPI003562ADDF
MRKFFKIATSFFILFVIFSCTECKSEKIKGTIYIDSSNGHELEEGCSGFNVRIADKVWSYKHPDFRAAVHGLKPGWLRYFSGTMGDAFNSATGLYDKDYIWMFDHQKMYSKGYAFTEVKGPHRIIDLYELLGEVGGKLVVTINGFSESPQVAGELARFCKNNNIKVEVWQFCNEPYFYLPSRDRYWWNDGYDYAAKMKPYADSIQAVFPDANLALNCSWDGVKGFMKEIYRYQQENGAYWNVFSKHSYAPHVGGRESFQKAYKRANSKLIEVTSSEAMSEIEDYTWKGVPLLITEFGVWNSPLNGIFSAIYNAEYTLRQLAHSNAYYIGSHEISNKYKPAKNYDQVILDAYNSGKSIDTDLLLTGIVKDDEGKALEIVHEATNNSSYTYATHVDGGTLVDGLENKKVNGVYARAFKGFSGYDYLIVTNRSDKYHQFKVNFGDQQLKGKVERTYMYSDVPQKKNIEVQKDVVKLDPLEVPPFSVVMVKWESNQQYVPIAPRIYTSKVTSKGIELKWWKRDSVDGYEVAYGMDPQNLSQTVCIKGAENNQVLLTDVEPGKQYYFGVSARNKQGVSELSELVTLSNQKPDQVAIFKIVRRDSSITVMWKSVPNALGYKLKVKGNDFSKEYDANNVFGYRINGLKYDVPYQIVVIAYNGLGEGQASKEETVICKEHLPIPPRNISARETVNNQVYLEWVNQDTINPDVQYRLYRGTKLHEFTVLAEGIVENHFLDQSVQDYFYTVKSYNADGECNFHPNIATVIKRDQLMNIDIAEVRKMDDHYLVSVRFSNIKRKKNVHYGIAFSDISYLNEEEKIIEATQIEGNEFRVAIPFDLLKQGREYAIRGFVSIDEKYIYSLPPHHLLKME